MPASQSSAHSTNAPNRSGRIWASTFVRPFIHRLKPNGSRGTATANRDYAAGVVRDRICAFPAMDVVGRAAGGDVWPQHRRICRRVLAGVFTLEDALMLVALRGRLIQSMPPGSMLAVRMAEADVVPLLGPELALAAMNGPSQCVVSGPIEAVATLQERLTKQGVVGRPLATSHAFHSPMLEPIVDRFAAAVAGVPRKPPTIPFFSCVTGGLITASRRPTRPIGPSICGSRSAADALRSLIADGNVLLEVGPGRTLANLARQQAVASSVIVSALPRPEDDDTEVAACSRPWAGSGWLARQLTEPFDAPARRRRVAADLSV